MTETILYKNFIGVSDDEDKSSSGYLAKIVGVDIYGTGGGTSTSAPHRQKTYQPSQRMVAETEAAATNNITDMIQWIAPFNGKTYGLSDGARFYESSTALGGTWTLEFATSASTGGGGLLPFGSNCYYGQDTVLGKFDGASSNHNFQTFNIATAGPRPMAIIAGRLAIGNQRNIATLDSDETTFNATRLQLPIGYVARSFEVWNDFLAIAADFTPPSATNPISSRLFLWDGTAASYTEAAELPFTSAPLLIVSNNLLWIIGSDTASNLLIYAYNGSSIQQAFFLSNTIPHGLGSKAKFQGNILFGTNGRTTSDNGGIWMIGVGDNPVLFGISMPFVMSTGSLSNTNVGGLYAEANDILGAWYDGTNYGIDKSSNAVFPNSGSYIQTLPMYMGNPTNLKSFYDIKMDLENPSSATSASLQIQYKKDLASSWTNLKTISLYSTSATYNMAPTIPIGLTGRRLELKFNWATSADYNPLRLRSFAISYDIHPNL